MPARLLELRGSHASNEARHTGTPPMVCCATCHLHTRPTYLIAVLTPAYVVFSALSSLLRCLEESRTRQAALMHHP